MYLPGISVANYNTVISLKPTLAKMKKSKIFARRITDLFNPNGAMRRTAKSNLLNDIEIKRYSIPSLMANSDLGEIVTDFMVILESIDRSNFERFSNVADEVKLQNSCQAFLNVKCWL